MKKLITKMIEALKIIACCVIVVVIMIVSFPFIAIVAPFVFWHKQWLGSTVKDVLKTGKYGYDGEIIICTNINNVIFEGRVGILDIIPEAIEKMAVYQFEAKDGKLWFQVYKNDKLINQMKEQLRSY